MDGQEEPVEIIPVESAASRLANVVSQVWKTLGIPTVNGVVTTLSSFLTNERQPLTVY